MVKNFRNLKIAQVGLRPRPFCSVIFNEGELMQKFGIRCIPVNIGVVVDKYNKILAERDAELEAGAQLLLSRYEMDDLTPPLLKKVYAFVLLYQELFEELGVSAISAECWTAMPQSIGVAPCLAMSVLADRGYLVTCESDVYGAITQALLKCATRGKGAPLFGEFTVRHPENKNSELLWHCGPFAYSLKKEGVPCKNVNMRQWFQVKDGEYTGAVVGHNGGDLTVKVVIAGGKIASVEVVSHTETAGISDAPIASVPAAIVAGNTVAVDTVAGATLTSNRIMDAVALCLEQAAQ